MFEKLRREAVLAWVTVLGLLTLLVASVVVVHRNDPPASAPAPAASVHRMKAYRGTTAKFKVNGTASTPPGFDATSGQTLTFQLETSPAPDVYRVQYSVYSPSDSGSPLASKDAPVLTLSPSNGVPTTPTGTVTVTMPGSGAHSWLVRCVVNNGVEAATGKVIPEWTYSRIVAIRSASGIRKQVPGETTEYSPRGWTDELNLVADIPSGTPSGPAGNDLCGSFPSPIVCKGGVTDLTGLRAVSTANLKNREHRVVGNGTHTGEIGQDSSWEYRSDLGAGQGDDGFLVVLPNDKLLAQNGRWINAAAVPTIPTVTVLKTLTSTFHSRVHVFGYDTILDGGGGDFIYQGAYGAANNGTVIATAGGLKWWRVYDGPINVRYFGVLPAASGTTNRTRLNAMFATYADTAGSRYFVPAGSYAVDDEIQFLHQSGAMLEGAGQQASRFLFTGAPNADKAVLRLMYATNNTIRGVAFNANGAAGYGVLLSSLDKDGALVGGASGNLFEQVAGQYATVAGLAIGQRRTDRPEVNLDNNTSRSSTFSGDVDGVSVNGTNANWTLLEQTVGYGTGASGTVRAGIEFAQAVRTSTVRNCGVLVPNCVFDVADPWKDGQCANIVVGRGFSSTLRLEDIVLELRPETGRAPAVYVERISGGTAAVGQIVIDGMTTTYNCAPGTGVCSSGDTLWPILAIGNAGTTIVRSSIFYGAGAASDLDSGAPMPTPLLFDSFVGGGGPTPFARSVFLEAVTLANGAYISTPSTFSSAPMRVVDTGTFTLHGTSVSTQSDFSLTGAGQRFVAPGYVTSTELPGVTMPTTGINGSAYKLVIDKSALFANATTVDLDALTLYGPRPTRLVSVVTKTTEHFSFSPDGGGGDQVTVSVGSPAGPAARQAYVQAHAVSVGVLPIWRGLRPGAPTVDGQGIGYLLDQTAYDAGANQGGALLASGGNEQVRISFISSGASFGTGTTTNLGSGRLEVWLKFEPME